MYKEERQVFSIPSAMTDNPTHFCPGCHHGIIHRLVAECLSTYQLAEQTICVGSVGCSVFIYQYIDVDTVIPAHGRAPAVATGVKRSSPDNFVFAYQGDGDLAAIGLAEIMHCANRGENISLIFVNNTVFGMTGGQMAPTTMVGQKTTTSPMGRNQDNDGCPLKMAELIGSLKGTAYSARVAVDSIKHLNQAKKALKRAFDVQLNKQGFGFVEFISACPTNWRMTPLQANQRVGNELTVYFPLGTFKDIDKETE